DGTGRNAMDAATARDHLEGLVRGATDYAHLLAGVKAGLIDAIARCGTAGAHPARLADDLGCRADHVRVWCQTALAIGVLEAAGEVGVLEAGDDDRFCVAAGFAEVLPATVPGSLAPLLRMHEPFVAERLEFAELLRSGGERPRSAATFDRAREVALVPRARLQ